MFVLLTQKFVRKFFFRWVNFFFITFELLTRGWKIKFHFQLLSRSWKIKSFTSRYLLEVGKESYGLHRVNSLDKLLFLTSIFKNLLRVTNSKNEKIKSCFRSRSRFFYWNKTLYDLELIEKNVGMLAFVILDRDLSLNGFCL